MIDSALVETDKEKQAKDYGEIQTYIERSCLRSSHSPKWSTPSLYRADIKGLALNPSWSTDLSVVSKSR